MVSDMSDFIDEKGYEVSSLLQSINVSRIEALSIACLLNGCELSSQDIENVTGLRQPEVSVAMRPLCERGWVGEKNEKRTKCRGRPAKYYSLNMDFAEILTEYESDILKENEKRLEVVKSLRNLVD